ncbi:MAG: GNAT family N-acetyltransferase [Demequinaceae bacterium]|nr:GNAT family N-acetyltransferase [Demequinaceae bacterium]
MTKQPKTPTLPRGYRLIDLSRDRDIETFDITAWAFAFEAQEKFAECFLDMYPWERGRGIEIADPSRGKVGALVAAHSSHALHMKVPGGTSIPVSGLTWVGTHPGHRRRRLLTTMVADHFERSRARGEAISILYAAESAIYQRFGYGLAARERRVRIKRRVKLRPIPGSEALTVRLESADIDRHAPIVEAVQAARLRPGSLSEIPEGLFHEHFLDLEGERDGFERLRMLMIYDGETPKAYALFQRKDRREYGNPKGIVKVNLWGSVSAAATHRLWTVLSDLDLMDVTEAGKIALDDPLLHMIIDERSLTSTVRDNLWLRILDVKAALEARGYEADCDVTIELTDARLPDNAGVWRIRVDGGTAEVTRIGDVGDPADLGLSIQELGAAYLGGNALESLQNAALVDERTPGSLHALSLAMRSPVSPVSNISF